MSQLNKTDGQTTQLDLETIGCPPTNLHVIEAVSNEILFHSQVEMARRNIERAITENLAHSEPRHVMVIGESGCGKTTLLDYFSQHLCPKQENFTLGVRLQQPALIFSLPSTITPRSIAVRILRELGDLSALHGTCEELTERVRIHIRQCNVRVIFMDEFQHLLALGPGSASGANKRLIEARNWIKSIINATHVTFVLLGTPEAQILLDSEDQLERRFTHRIHLAPFDMPTNENREMVHFVDALLGSAVTASDRIESAELFSNRPDDAMRLHVASNGVPSTIKDLVIRAALQAHRRNATEITMDDFAYAFNQARQGRAEQEAAMQRREKRRRMDAEINSRHINPFVMRWDDVRALIHC